MNNQFNNSNNQSNNSQNNQTNPVPNNFNNNLSGNVNTNLNQSMQTNSHMNLQNNSNNYDNQNYSNQINNQQFSEYQNNSFQSENYNNSNPTFINNQTPKKGKGCIAVLVIIAIIAIIIVAIFIVIPIFGVNNTLDNTRKNAFVASARTYINKTKVLINTDDKGIYKPDCVIDDTKYISLADIDVVSASPFGGYYQVGLKYNESLDYSLSDSYVMVKTSDNNCNYVYSIYLTDGTHEIGSSNAPILESNLDVTLVK